MRHCLVYWSLDLGMTNTAKETLEQCTDTHKVIKLYLRLKIALEEDNSTDAIAAVHKMLQLVKEANRLEHDNIAKKVSNALIYAASLTLKAGKMDITKDVLKQMVSPPERNPALAELQLKCLQCVVALCLTNFEQNSMGFSNIYREVSDCTEKAANILFVCENGMCHAEQSQWFATVCWNLALQPEANAEQQFRLLGHSFRLMLNLSSVEQEHRTAKAVLAQVLSLSGDNTDIIEGFVAICQDAGCKKAAFSVPLLRRCIGLTAAQNEPDKLVKYYHLLFQALLDARDEDGLVACTDEVIKLNCATFPETELVWMMTTVWNEGLQRYIEGALPSAKRYLNCTLRIVDILPTLKVAYQQRLLSRYQGLFEDKMDQQSATNDDPA
ncbi:hypothetical protein MTO96_024282 [Rhipicephalus appendiculatus]